MVIYPVLNMVVMTKLINLIIFQPDGNWAAKKEIINVTLLYACIETVSFAIGTASFYIEVK